MTVFIFFLNYLDCLHNRLCYITHKGGDENVIWLSERIRGDSNVEIMFVSRQIRFIVITTYCR